ncbi:MAG: helix-turn-helix transcriptional regulator [Firmicutes bacterium]|nr:helix-turn-helix transcriptional regulator [Bacillota bacterium]
MSEQELNQVIANNISFLLQTKGKSQSELADYMNVSQATVSNWCKGIKTPRMDKIDKIAVFFNVNRSRIMEEYSNEYITNQEDLSAIMHLMEQLNEEGQEKVIEFAEFVVASGKYKKHGQSELDQKEA